MQNKKSTIKKIYKKIFRNYYYGHIKKWLYRCNSLLDLGCGFDSPVKFSGATLKIGVDVFQPYIDRSKEKNIHNKYIKEDITKVQFKYKSFDAVLALDVLEHLPKKDSLEMLKKMETWARKKVILSLPNGFMPQGVVDSNPAQVHRCAWTVEELEELGFKVYGFNGLKILGPKAGMCTSNPDPFWFFVSDLSQIVVHHIPKLAFNLLAVKELKNKARN